MERSLHGSFVRNYFAIYGFVYVIQLCLLEFCTYLHSVPLSLSVILWRKSFCVECQGRDMPA